MLLFEKWSLTSPSRVKSDKASNRLRAKIRGSCELTMKCHCEQNKSLFASDNPPIDLVKKKHVFVAYVNPRVHPLGTESFTKKYYCKGKSLPTCACTRNIDIYEKYYQGQEGNTFSIIIVA